MRTKSRTADFTESDTTETELSDVSAGVHFRGSVKRESSKLSKKSNKETTKRIIDSKPKTFLAEDSAQKPEMVRSMPLPVAVKKSDFKVRAIWTVAMLGSFSLIILAGHVYCALLVLFISVGMVREILALKRDREKESRVGYSLNLNYYFSMVVSFYFFGKVILNELTIAVYKSRILLFFATYHVFISFMLWITGFLIFVLSLKKGCYRYQFRQFGWTHISTMMIVGQTAAMVSNIFEGLIWLLLPSLLVISNDCCAYIFGLLFGRTRLIELSPKKTWEGFIGGCLSTLFFAVIFSYWFMNSQYLICPQRELQLIPFQFINCTPSNIFESSYYNILGWQVPIAEIQIHAVILALFVSLVSPFGGFFASGFKRAIKVKDFADVIPGHGGITDRMDCQIITGTFAYLYVQQIVLGKINYVSGVTRYILSALAPTDQLAIYLELNRQLIAKGVLNATQAMY